MIVTILDNRMRPNRSINEPQKSAPHAIEIVTIDARFDELSRSILISLSATDNWGMSMDENAMLMPAWMTTKLTAQLAKICGIASLNFIFGLSLARFSLIDSNFVSLFVILFSSDDIAQNTGIFSQAKTMNFNSFAKASSNWAEQQSSTHDCAGKFLR